MNGSRAAWTEALHIKETLNYICLNFLKKITTLETKGNLLCLVCRRVVRFLFAPKCIFHCMSTYERLLPIETLKKCNGFHKNIKLQHW